MKERPILFSAPMVRALLAGTKTQTRRVVKHPHAADIDVWADAGGGVWELGVTEAGVSASMGKLKCPYGQPGDRLWVRETTAVDYFDGPPHHGYRADWSSRAADVLPEPKWTPSIHVPRRASRLTLEVTGVRVERLQAISEADAVAEGIERVRGRDVPAAMGGNVETWRDYLDPERWQTTPRGSYFSLWESINGPGSWAENPWVWVVEFKRVTP